MCLLQLLQMLWVLLHLQHIYCHQILQGRKLFHRDGKAFQMMTNLRARCYGNTIWGWLEILLLHLHSENYVIVARVVQGTC